MSKIIDTAKSVAIETGSFVSDSAKGAGETARDMVTAKGRVHPGWTVFAGIMAPTPVGIAAAAAIGAYSVGKGIYDATARRAGTKHDPHAQVEQQPAEEAAKVA